MEPTTTTPPSRTFQLLDLNAVLWAGVVSGGIYLIINLILSQVLYGDPWFALRVAASLILGPGVIFEEPGIQVLITGLAIQIILALLYTLLIAFIFHRGGLLAGLLGGALVGLALYSINYNNFAYFFPWIFPLRNSALLGIHLFFGALSGFLYELFEDDEPDLQQEQ
jgi:hypothetical protein